MRINRTNPVRALVWSAVWLIAFAVFLPCGMMNYSSAMASAPQSPASGQDASLVGQGAELFKKNCAGCHSTDKAESKDAPGLKGLFSRDKLPVSGLPPTEETIRKQLKTPAKTMPSYKHFTEDQVKALMAYMRTL